MKIALICFLALLLAGCGQNQEQRLKDNARIKELEAEISALKAKQAEQPSEAARRAMKELKKINSVVEMGVDYTDYKRMLVETKPSFDEAISEIPDGNLKKAFVSTMDAYVDAGQYWYLFAKKPEWWPPEKEFQRTEAERFAQYKLAWRDDGHKELVAGKERFTQDILAIATARLSQATEIMNRETATK